MHSCAASRSVLWGADECPGKDADPPQTFVPNALTTAHSTWVRRIFARSWPWLLTSYAHTVLNSSEGHFGPSRSSGLIFSIGLSHCHLQILVLQSQLLLGLSLHTFAYSWDLGLLMWCSRPMKVNMRAMVTADCALDLISENRNANLWVGLWGSFQED